MRAIISCMNPKVNLYATWPIWKPTKGMGSACPVVHNPQCLLAGDMPTYSTWHPRACGVRQAAGEHPSDLCPEIRDSALR